MTVDLDTEVLAAAWRLAAARSQRIDAIIGELLRCGLAVRAGEHPEAPPAATAAGGAQAAAACAVPPC